MTTDHQPARNEADDTQSEHEVEGAEHVESGGTGGGQRPTSGEELAADRTSDERENADVVGDDQSSPGQNSDRLPQ